MNSTSIETTTTAPSTTSAWSRIRRTATAGLAAVAALGGLTIAGATSAEAAPHAAKAAKACQWVFSSGAAHSFQKLGTSTVPLSTMNFGTPWGGHLRPIAQDGLIDFDKDGTSDVFTAYPEGHGVYQWQYRSKGVGSWHVLGRHGQNASNVRFGDFNGDGRTDVLVADKAGSKFQYKYYSDGKGKAHNLMKISQPISQVRLGDFDGDGLTDVFVTNPAGNGEELQWSYFSDGRSDEHVTLAASFAPLSTLKFGDFDGDNITDVFVPINLGNGTFQWTFQSGGLSISTDLAFAGTPLSQLRIGDFNGDAISDVFNAQPVGSNAQWMFSRSGRGSFQNLAFGPAGNVIRIGDFDGDGTMDVFAGAC